MDRARVALPSVNPILTKKDRERNRRIHRRKLRTIKSSIDNGAPKGFKTNRKRKNPKKERMMEENYQKIERENRLLLKKMSSIMQVGLFLSSSWHFVVERTIVSSEREKETEASDSIRLSRRIPCTIRART